MSSFIIPSNKNKYDATNAFNDLDTVHWVQHNNKSVKIGDTIYIYESKPTQKIILKTTVIERDVYNYHINDAKYSVTGFDFSSQGPWFTLKLVKNANVNVSLEDLHNLGLKGNIQSLRYLDDAIAKAIDVISNDTSELTSVKLIEGKKIQFYTARYERNSKNRQACLNYYGYNCMACGFNFERMYGELGHKFIEIHHRKPLFLQNKEVAIDPTNDLVPLCSNCHRMIHREKTNIITLDELRRKVLIPYTNFD
ncbi:HNH endonuclease [Weissella hellenica]|uniref:5-methylcytosine-specific restriction enzyme A n=1 Tax=Weissella hellenica TaxID=46256 RepID=A0A4Y4G4P0_WEIHE|nr:HNH endonuclease [Weissella hellenica]NKY66616.1 hypothetical protein [Weissella hellenica]GED35194.1 hypothetical protein WHE01_00980 [Weissella hellenica]SCB94561.1 5-methylcytosine-specific restriction enzyme A [Weissella hellenica]